MIRAKTAKVRLYLRRFFLLPTTRTALRVALVVGTALNLINQGDVLWGNATVSWPHMALNYLVPYLVSSHSIVKAQHLD